MANAFLKKGENSQPCFKYGIKSKIKYPCQSKSMMRVNE